jgi:hypothetical protein
LFFPLDLWSQNVLVLCFFFLLVCLLLQPENERTSVFDDRFPLLTESLSYMEESPLIEEPPLRKAAVRITSFSSSKNHNTEIVKNGEITYHAGGWKSVKMMWETPPSLALLVVRLGASPALQASVSALVAWLRTVHVAVCMEAQSIGSIKDVTSLDELMQERDSNDPASIVDFTITIGGDGTVLHAASLFKRSCPPLISFNQGSLGFLTRHQLPNFRNDISALLRGEMFLIMRARLCCRVLKREPKGNGWYVAREHQVMNELVIGKKKTKHESFIVGNVVITLIFSLLFFFFTRCFLL